MGFLKRVGEDSGSDDDPEKDNTASVVSWLRINAIRGVVADVPSWVCYFAGFLFSMA